MARLVADEAVGRGGGRRVRFKAAASWRKTGGDCGSTQMSGLGDPWHGSCPCCSGQFLYERARERDQGTGRAREETKQRRREALICWLRRAAGRRRRSLAGTREPPLLAAALEASPTGTGRREDDAQGLDRRDQVEA